MVIYNYRLSATFISLFDRGLIMKKYVYEEYDIDSFSEVLMNEFHYLCMYLGAHLTFNENPNGFNTFREYAIAKELENGTNWFFRWCYINKAQARLRDKINSTQQSQINPISKREIRKLGYSGHLSRPRFPMSGTIIENELFSLVFDNIDIGELASSFLDYIYNKWIADGNTLDFYMPGDNERAVKNTATNFCGFQKQILFRYPDLFTPFFANNTYQYIQSELQKRRSHDKRKS